jgi:DNA helicase HerA-like ATPase
MDEGKFFAPKVTNSCIAFSPISYLYDQFRAYGVGLCLATHSPFYLEDTVFVNSHTKVALSLNSGEDNRKISSIFQLNLDQLNYLSGKLTVGEGIVHSPRFGGEPFVVQVPPFKS